MSCSLWRDLDFKKRQTISAWLALSPAEYVKVGENSRSDCCWDDYTQYRVAYWRGSERLHGGLLSTHRRRKGMSAF
jgi:hypothetical protein